MWDDATLMFHDIDPATMERTRAKAAIRKAAAEAGDWERQLESSSDTSILDKLQKEGKVKLVAFNERDKMRESMLPVLTEYAKEIGAEAIFAKINAIK